MRSRACQLGQALLLALLLTLAGSVGLYLMFRSGQSIAHKTRLVNVADAAAYGAAVWRARVMNFNAYANRAIVAQERAVAQALTLKSWSRYFAELAHNGARLASVYPPLAAVFDGLDAAAARARDMAAAAADAEVRARAGEGSGYKELLQDSQELLTLSAGTFGMSAVANEVARASDRQFFAFALSDGGAFGRMTRRYETDVDRGRLRDVVERSLDDFTSGPRSTDRILWGLPATCALSPNRPADWFQMFRKRGGTQLAPGLDRWEAADTASMHDNLRTGFFGLHCSRVEWLPLGWGAAEVALERPLGELAADPGRVSVNPTATLLAVQDLATEAHETGEARGRYAGISRVRELAYERFDDPRFPRTRVAVLARIGATDLVRNPALVEPVDRMRPRGGERGGRLWALSSAEVYFRRPRPRHDGVEYASLYSPYWQVRLVAPTETERRDAEAHVH